MMKKIIAAVSALIVIVVLGIFIAANAKENGTERIDEMGNITSIDVRFKLESVEVTNEEQIQQACAMIKECELEKIDYDGKGWIYELVLCNDKEEQCKIYIIDERTVSIDDVTYKSSTDIDIELLDEITGIVRE